MSGSPTYRQATKTSNIAYLQWFIIDNPWLCLLVSIVIVSLAGFGLNFSVFNNDPKEMFSEEHEGLRLLEEVEAHFTKDDNVIFVVIPKNGDIFTRENLALLENITEQAWTIPKAVRVDSITNFQHTLVDHDDLEVMDLVSSPDTLTHEDISQIKKIALNEPYLVNNVISPSGHVAAINVTIVADDLGGQDSPTIMNFAEAMRDRFKLTHPDVKILLSGQVAFFNASQTATMEGIVNTSILSTGAIILCLFFMLRNVLYVFYTLIIITLSNVVAGGAISWFGVQLNPVMGGAPAIILTLAVADSIHILMTFQQNFKEGLSKADAMCESLRVNMQPVFLTSITTAVGFLFLNSSKSPPFADMANMVCIGVMAAWFLSIVLLPALVMIIPSRQYQSENQRQKCPEDSQSHSNSKSLADRSMSSFADFIIFKRKPVFIIASLICVILALFSLKNEFNDVWVEYFDESFEARVATEFLVKELAGHHRIQFGFPSGKNSGIMEPDYMDGLDRFQQWAREHQHVIYVASYSDTLKRINRDMNGGRPDFYRVPDNRELISQYTLLYQLMLPFGLGLENQINMDQSISRVDVLLDKLSSKEIIAFEKEASEWIRENLPTKMHSRGVGFDLILGELSYENAQGMLVGTALALVVVSLLLVFALKSLKYGLLSMLPNLLPALISFGIWAFINGQIGISVSIVACMTLGIVIDNTVHFLSKYTRAKDENNFSTFEATRHAFNSVGMALVATTIVIAANFGIMASSHYYPTASMGLLTAITVVVALLVNFFFFVPVLLFVDRDDQ